jgi:aminoglycoside phosphotransferase (APT) family kinase protein
LTLSRLGSGRSTITSAAADQISRRWIVREPRASITYDVGREADVMTALIGSGITVPRVIGHSVARNGLSFVVMEQIDRQPLQDEEAAEQLTPDVRLGIGRQVVKTMAPARAGSSADRNSIARPAIRARTG